MESPGRDVGFHLADGNGTKNDVANRFFFVAREASKRIVGNILQDAGVEESEYSPTMVKMNEDILNDSF